MYITVYGINRSLDMLDSVFLNNEDTMLVLSPLPFEFELPNPILEVIPGFDYQFSETITNLNYVYTYDNLNSVHTYLSPSYYDVVMIPPPPLTPLSPSLMSPASSLTPPPYPSPQPSTDDVIMITPPPMTPVSPILMSPASSLIPPPYYHTEHHPLTSREESPPPPTSRPESPTSAEVESTSPRPEPPQFLVPAAPGTSSGRMFNDPPPSRNFYCDSDDSDVQIDHFGVPLRTRSQTSSVASSIYNNSTGINIRPPSHKVQCDICNKFYSKSYLKRHVLIHNK